MGKYSLMVHTPRKNLGRKKIPVTVYGSPESNELGPTVAEARTWEFEN